MPATDRTSRRDVTVDVHPQGVAYKLGPGQSAVVRRKPRIGGVHVAQPEDVLTCRALAVPGRARNAGQPLDVLPGELLRLGAGRVGAAPGGQIGRAACRDTMEGTGVVASGRRAEC